MNNKIYYTRVKQEKFKITQAEKKADDNFIAAIAVCVILSIICFSKCSLELKKQSYANTNIQPVLQK